MKTIIRTFARRALPKTMHRRALSHSRWQEIEEDLLPILANPNRIAFDIGANVGSYTSKLSPLTTAVVAFEPTYELAAFLRRARYRNVEVICKAVTQNDKGATLYVPVRTEGPATALSSIDRSVFRAETRLEACAVETVAMDSFAERNVGFIKIDVEGQELQVLRGGTKLLTLQQPVVLVEIEYRHSPTSFDEVCQLFERLGYAGFFILDGRTLSVSEFSLDLQDVNQLVRPVPRRQMRYVNNFIFAPAGMVEDLRYTVEAEIRRA